MKMQYRVRLLNQPVMLYNGHDFTLATRYMDSTSDDRVLERREHDGWRSIISVESGR